MNSVIFDTLAFVKRLKQSGFDEAQAEALSDAFKEAQKTAIDDLATKADIKDVKHEIALLCGEMTLFRNELVPIKWVMGFVMAGILSLMLKAFLA